MLQKALHLGIDQILVYIMATYRHCIVMGYFNIVIYSSDQKTMTKSTCIPYTVPLLQPNNTSHLAGYFDCCWPWQCCGPWAIYPSPGLFQPWSMTDDLIFCTYTLTSLNQIFISYRKCNKIDNYEAFSNKAFALPGFEVLLASGVDFIISAFKFLFSCPYDQHALLINKESDQAKSTLFTQFYLSVTNT